MTITYLVTDSVNPSVELDPNHRTIGNPFHNTNPADSSWETLLQRTYKEPDLREES